MTKMKKVVSYVLVFLTVFSSFTILPSEFWGWADVSATDVTTEKSNETTTYREGDFIYSIIDEDTVEIKGYYGTRIDVVIPDVTTGSEYAELADKKVVSIGRYVFEKRYLTSVKFGKNIRRIYDYAFFESTGLTELDLSVCTELTTLDRCAFAYNTSLKTIIFPDSLETIGIGAFYGCDDLEELNIPDGVVSICSHAFSNNESLKNIKIGSGCTFLHPKAFDEGKAIENITVSEDNTVYSSDDGILLNKDKTAIMLYPKARSGAYTIPNNITEIGESSFDHCDNLTEIIISDSVTTIGNGAFSFCGNLTEIIISDSVTTIGNGAFAICDNLTKVVIGDGVKTIGDVAFNGCVKLSQIEFGKNITSIGGAAFNQNEALTKVDLSACTGLTKIGDDAFQYNTSLSTLILPKNLEFIGSGAFYACYSLTSLDINLSNLTSIGRMAFYNCYRLKTVNIENGNGVVIETEVFSYCFELESVTIGNGVKTIEPYAFMQCVKLKNVKIGEDVESIGWRAFFRCPASTTVEILSKNITNIYPSDFVNDDICTIYCYKNSTTHNTLKSNGYKNIKFFTSDVHLTDITVNGTSVDSFNTETKDYTVYLDNTTDVSIVPVFEEENVTYTVTAENNVHTITVFDENDEVIDKYKITVKKYNYTVTGDVTLMLNNIASTKVGGSIALPAGTYKLKIAKGEKLFGYNKVVADYCNGLTLNPKFTSYITLNATGGTYTFQFDTITNKLVIKHDKNLPNEYLIGDLDTILKPVENKPLSIGTQQLPAGTYKFKLSIGGKEYGYNKVVDNATTGSLSVNSKYSSYITLNVTGGIYTFTLNTETNKLTIRHTPIADECTTDVHISGDFNLVLNDKSTTGEDLTKATGTINLASGCYTFKVYNYGVAYTVGLTVNDSGKKTLSSKYTTPVTLNATGGTYQFTFDKVTGALSVKLVG